jgi:hypothetical protein
MSIYKTQKVIDVSDWDDLVVETYKRPYSFQQQDGCKERQRVRITIPDHAYDFENDTVPEVVNGDEMGVSFKAWLEREPEQALNTDDEWDRTYGIGLFWERNFYPDVQMIANDLHAKGLIEAGDYVIDSKPCG